MTKSSAATNATPPRRCSSATRAVPGPLRWGLIEPVAALIPFGSRIPAVRKARSYIAQARVPLPDRFETYNFLHRTPLAEVFDPDFLAAVDAESPLVNLREVYARTASTATVNRMMHLDLKITLADNDLRKVEQACGLAGVDVAYPLLDDAMLEFAARLPAEMQVKGGQLRWFFKRALEDFLPQEIIRKTKHGFGLPVGIWMAEHAQLRDLTGDSSPRSGVAASSHRPTLIGSSASTPANTPLTTESCSGSW